MTATQDKAIASTNGKKEAPNALASVSNAVRGYISRGTLHLPTDYSPENALKSAWLLVQEVKDRDGKDALSVCTQESVANALLDMVVQGLNPVKKQCYFIVYGKKLICQRSYFGDQALALRVRPGIEIYSSVIYGGDEFETEMIRGRTTVARHKSKLDNQKLDNIVGAYCGIVDVATGEDLGCEVMTMDQIKKSWGMSKTYSPSGNKGTHHDFPDQMALRTVIRRRCKPIINSSSDALLLEAIRRQDEDAIEAEIAEEATIHGNGEMLSLPVTEQQEQSAAPEEPVAQAKAEDSAQPGLGEAEPEF